MTNESTEQENKLRISFHLNLDRYPQFSYFKEIKGRGAYPEELIRLATLGLQAQREQQELLRASRQATLASLSHVSTRSAIQVDGFKQQDVVKMPPVIDQEIESDTVNNKDSIPDDPDKPTVVVKDTEITLSEPAVSPGAAQTLRGMLA